MTDKEAIEYLKNYKYDNEVREAIETILNLIQTQQEEIENKDKESHFIQSKLDKSNAEIIKLKRMIDEMAKKINQAYFDENKFCLWFEKMMGVQQKIDYGYVVDLIKQYFERK